MRAALAVFAFALAIGAGAFVQGPSPFGQALDEDRTSERPRKRCARVEKARKRNKAARAARRKGRR